MKDAFRLYVHIPWCRRICPYCDFNVHAATEPPAMAYAAAVGTELAAHAADPRWTGRPVRTVYLGGGTPSLFPPEAIAALLLAATRSFGLVEGAEVTLEANPGTVSRDRLRGYRDAGVNRLSLGAQSFHSAHLATLGRDHGADETARAVEAARAAGFENVSLDLMFGVPGEAAWEWERDLAAAIALRPEHASTYALTYEPGTPFHAWRANGRITPVGEDEEAAMAAVAETRLGAAGLVRYEISSFARPGRECRHNLGYWDGSDYLGVGAGAHSFTSTPASGHRWINEREPGRYLAAVARDGTAVAGEERLTETQARGEFVFTGLRQIAGVDADRFARRFGTSLEAAFPQVADLVAEGLLERATPRVRLTARGLTFADAVAVRFV